ncbi:zinc finger CCCH domain-containing protein 48-like protein [Tanacetum coccineum]
MIENLEVEVKMVGEDAMIRVQSGNGDWPRGNDGCIGENWKHNRSYRTRMLARQPNSNGSHFFICTVKTPWLDDSMWCLGKFLKAWRWRHSSFVVHVNIKFGEKLELQVWNVENLQCLQTSTNNNSVVMSILYWDHFLSNHKVAYPMALVWEATSQGHNLEVTLHDTFMSWTFVDYLDYA